jgi:ribosomal protein S18 acetylase RimI-like enzyme
MKLLAAADHHLAELMGWFPDPASCRIWGGPDFRFPFTAETFRADAKFDGSPSFSLLGDAGELLGFGQYYLRAGRCHLARLAVSPQHRGLGCGEFMVRELCRRGAKELQTSHCSLFVYDYNTAAIRLYHRLGFAFEPYPEATPLPEGCLYMAAPAGDVGGGLHVRGNQMTPSSDPATVVQRQLDAYNARDIDALMDTYADDVQVFEHPSILLANGAADLRARQSLRLQEPNLHARLVNRIVLGQLVIDHEMVTRTFPEGTGELEMIGIYQVEGAKIAKVWFAFGAKRLD